MQNKGYVIGLLVAAAALLYGTFSLATGENALFALAPLALAVGMCVVAWRVSKAESFSPKKEQRWQSMNANEGVTRWHQRHADADDARRAGATAAPVDRQTK